MVMHSIILVSLKVINKYVNSEPNCQNSQSLCSQTYTSLVSLNTLSFCRRQDPKLFFFLLKHRIFKTNTLLFRAVLGSRQNLVLMYPLSPRVHSPPPPAVSMSHHSSAPVKSHNPTMIHHYHPKSIV